jgi:hypothetical protein
MTILYAWVTPAFIQNSPADHTWVTSYDSRQNVYPEITDVTNASQNFWFCWGKYRPGGTPSAPIAVQAGNLAFAQCLVQPNYPSDASWPARGTIFHYAIEGVCHQLANQVLFATGGPGVAPATVALARWYRYSSAIYGDYGLAHSDWLARIAACQGSTGLDGAEPTGFEMPDDSFDQALGSLLGEGDPRLDAVRTLREAHQAEVRGLRALTASPEATAAVLNARHQHFFDQVAELLGNEAFEQLFGFPAMTEVNLVDPEQIETPDGTPEAG